MIFIQSVLFVAKATMRTKIRSHKNQKLKAKLFFSHSAIISNVKIQDEKRKYKV